MPEPALMAEVLPDLFAALPSASAPTSGACSKITCAFVPLIPNDDTAARRGRSLSGHARASPSSAIAPEDQSTCRVGCPRCSVAGSCPCLIAAIILITPATPAAASVCPMFDLIDPSHSGFSTSCSGPYTA